VPFVFIIEKRILTGIMILMMSLPAVIAQQPHVQKVRVAIPGKEPQFTRAVQDRNGYLWLGSQDGLFRYDGHSFLEFTVPGDSIELHITALHESPDGLLRIGCKDGRIYNMVNGVVSPVESATGKAITDIITDRSGNLWWSTAGAGIFYYRDDRLENFNHSSPSGLPDDYVYDLELTSTGDIWAGTDAGAVRLQFQTSGLAVVNPPSHIRFPDIMVRVIKEDRDGKLWLGFQDGGTGYLEKDLSSFISSCPNETWAFGAINDLLPLGDVTWAGTADGNLIEINAESQSCKTRMISSEDLIKGNIYDLLEDKEGNVWILSHSGLYRTTGNHLMFLDRFNGLSLENIHAITNDAGNPDRIWFSNDQGLFSTDLSNGKVETYLGNFRKPDMKIMCLYQDRHGNIWAGTFNYGVFRIRPEDGTWTRITENEGLVNNNVLAISGHDDTIWMATLGGASELILKGDLPGKPFTISSHNRETGLVSNFIYSVFEDKNDQIWFGTDGDGISVMTKNGWISYNENHGLTDDVIYSITGDQYGNIWVASAGEGIFRFTEGRFTRFSTREGLSSTDITAIAAVGDELVIVNENGMDFLHIPSGRISHSDEENGLSGLSPDLNVISTDRRGYLWIGTRKGIIRYQAGNKVTSYGPVTVLEEMSVYLEPRAMQQDLFLNYNENHVSFKYDGIWYANSEKVNYQVYLEGYDLGWKDTYDRQITYSSLPAGKYTFKVRSSLGQSFTNASEAGFSFTIRRPFWLNDWFILLLIMLISGVVFLIITYREQKLRKIEQEKKEKVEFEFQVLKNQVNPHFLFNSFSTLISLIEDQPEEAVRYTEKLSDFFRTILQYKDQEVISLKEELVLIENYFFLLKKRFGDNLNLDISLKDKVKESFIPPMTLQILIENAVKHNVISKDRPLFIRICEEEEKIIVENNLQPKQTAEVSTGIGLENIRKRYRLIAKAEPEIVKTGDAFTVGLPVIR